MSELVNSALDNQIDVPHYLFHSADELSLCIPAGKVLDEATEGWFDLFDGFIANKTGSSPLTPEHQMVLAYLLKGERLNRDGYYTLALTPGNNHFGAIAQLKNWRLIELHPCSDRFKEVYVVCREFATEDVSSELRQIFGGDFDELKPIGRQTLQPTGRKLVSHAPDASHESVEEHGIDRSPHSRDRNCTPPPFRPRQRGCEW